MVKRRRGLAMLWVLLASAAYFFAGWGVPLRAGADTGFQLRGVQQWLAGATSSPGLLSIPDPDDLSRDKVLWSSHWPPAFPLLTALPSQFLPLASAVRVVGLVAFLIGACGYVQLSADLRLSARFCVLALLSLTAYIPTMAGAASMRTAEVLAFGVTPWVLLVARRVMAGPTPAGLAVLGGAGGLTYGVRYSALLSALATLVGVSFFLAGARQQPVARRLRLLLAVVIGALVPVAGLLAVHVRLATSARDAVTGARSAFIERPTDGSTEAPILLASLLAAPGLAAFQSHVLISHVTLFAKTPLRAFVDSTSRNVHYAQLALAFPITVLLGLGLWNARELGDAAIWAVLVLGGFLSALLLLSVLVGYNYLLFEPRLAAPVMAYAQIVALAGLQGSIATGGWSAKVRHGLTSAAVVLPVLFASIDFGMNDIGERQTGEYEPGPSGLFTPELTRGAVGSVQRAVDALRVDPATDVVVVAGSNGWGGAFVMWLDLPGRVLPLSTFTSPLGEELAARLDVRASSVFSSSRALRIILVIDRSLMTDGTVDRVLARLPNCSAWRSEQLGPEARVELLYSDMRR